MCRLANNSLTQAIQCDVCSVQCSKHLHKRVECSKISIVSNTIVQIHLNSLSSRSFLLQFKALWFATKYKYLSIWYIACVVYCLLEIPVRCQYSIILYAGCHFCFIAIHLSPSLSHSFSAFHNPCFDIQKGIFIIH